MRDGSRVDASGPSRRIATVRHLSPGPLDSITRTVWRYRNIEACDVLRWMWEHGAAPLGSMMFGSRRQIGHWLSQAVVGRRTGVA